MHSSDHRPAGGASLFFEYGEERTQVATDAAGRFATEAVVPPGAVKVRLLEDEANPDYAVSLDVEPEVLWLQEPSAGGDFDEVELLLVDPPAWLAVEVFDAQGTPTAAELHWCSGSGAATLESGRRYQVGTSSTDAHGRVRLPLVSLAPGSWLSLLAQGAGDLVSEAVTVEVPPLPDLVQLTLDLGGIVRVRSLGADGQPLQGERLMLRVASEKLGFVAFRSEATDDSGEATFRAVAPGRYQVVGPDQAEEVGIDVERGKVTEVELRIPADPLAAAGLVLDAAGAPALGVEITLLPSAGERQLMSTDEHGRFAFRAPPSGPVSVSTEVDFLGDRYAPSSVEVPFGTSDLVFRCIESQPLTDLALEVVERGTLARIPGVMVLRFREPLRNEWAFASGPDGIATFQGKLLEGMCIAVEAPGYRRREFALLELVKSGPEGGPLRVELERGLERSLKILDENERPLCAARVWDGDRLVATADGEGRAALDLPSWPEALRITAPAHVDGVWSCLDWLWELEDCEVRLERAPEGERGD